MAGTNENDFADFVQVRTDEWTRRTRYVEDLERNRDENVHRIAELETENERVRRANKVLSDIYTRQVEKEAESHERIEHLTARIEELQKLALHYAEKAWGLQR